MGSIIESGPSFLNGMSLCTRASLKMVAKPSILPLPASNRITMQARTKQELHCHKAESPLVKLELDLLI